MKVLAIDMGTGAVRLALAVGLLFVASEAHAERDEGQEPADDFHSDVAPVVRHAVRCDQVGGDRAAGRLPHLRRRGHRPG
jgi:hypothetical protein